MKKSLLRLIALVLSLASLVSMLTVFSWAADTTDEEEYQNPYPDFNPTEELLYSRDFDEGWGPENGAANNMGQHTVEIDYEESIDYKYNYFMRFTYGNHASAGNLTFDFGARVIKSGTTIISLSIKADDACEAGRILYCKGTNTANGERDLLYIRNSNLYAFNSSSANFLCSLADNDWYDVDIVIDWSDNTVFHASAYLNGEYVTEISLANSSPDAGIKTLNLGLQAPSTADAANKAGMGYCVDNLDIYQETNQDVDFLPFELDPEWGYGVFVNQNADKTVDIYESAQQKTPEQILAESLGMKLGVGSALFKNQKISLDDYIIPTVVDGEIIVPLELIIDFMGYTYYKHPDGMSYDISLGSNQTAYVTIGRGIATVNGELVALDMIPGVVKNDNDKDVVVISMNDIVDIFPGWAVTYDDMGLIIVYEDISNGESEGNLINREDNLDDMLSMMKKFVFDKVDSDDGIEASYVATGEKIEAAVQATTQLQHPYIYTNQETFDKLSGIYAAADGDATLKSYIEKEVAKAEAYYKDVVESVDGNTVTFKEGKTPVNVYQDGVWPDASDPSTSKVVPDSDDGYNTTTSALYELEEFSAHLVELAFAYQMTGDTKYVKLAYAVSLALGEWVHWGPGYFVNTANAANDFAVSYDWLYNAYVEIYGEDAVETLAAILYDKALLHGYNSSVGEFCKFPRTAGYGDRYTTRTDSWNAICSAGMIVASMAIIGTDAYNENVTYLLGNNVTNLINYGLDQYAPDGSYIESVTYWALGTNAFMQTVMALESATGDDFGFKDTWGLDSTFYFACYIENSDGEAWNYHEDAVGTLVFADKLTVDTQMFNYAAQLVGDADLVAIRNAQIAKGKESTIYDILFYPDEPIGEAPELELTYVMEGIEAFVSRSDWENGALYVGIMGGTNGYSPYGEGEGEEQFGQIDSGNFIYQNDGIKWIIDHGSDNHYAYSYFGTYRYGYFRNSAEGHNVVILTSAATDVPYGQDVNAGGYIEMTYVDENGKGNYAVINNTKVYGSYATVARRGLLVLNDEETDMQTVVVQDEIKLEKSGNLTWVVNTAKDIIIYEDNNRVAYFVSEDADGNTVYLRATLVANNETYHFEILEDNTKLLRSTRDKDADQFNIGYNKRLVVEGENVIGLSIAVVFEVISHPDFAEATDYEWTDIIFWNNLFVEDDYDDGIVRRGIATREDILTQTASAQTLYDDAIAYTSYFVDYYNALCTVGYTLKTYPQKNFEADPITNAAYLDKIEDYNDMVEDYNDYIAYTNASVTQLALFVDKLSGKY